MVNRTIRDEFVEFAKQYNNGLPIDVCVEFDMTFNKRKYNATEIFVEPKELKRFIAKVIKELKQPENQKIECKQQK